MSDERRRLRRWVWLGIVLALVGAYAAAYVYSGELHVWDELRGEGPERWRYYPVQNGVKFFIPAAWVEAQITGCPVGINSTDPSWTKLEYRAEPLVDWLD